MQRSGRRTRLIFAGTLTLVVLVALAVLAVDASRSKSRWERAASDALGMQVRIGGRIDLRLFPRLHLGFDDGRLVGADGGTLLAVKRVRLGIRWWPLLRGKFRMNRVELLEPSFSFARDSAGTIGFDALGRGVEVLGAIEGATLSIVNGTVHFSDRRTGAGIDAGGIDVSVSRLRFADRDTSRTWAGSAIQARVHSDSIRTKNLRIADFAAAVTEQDGVLDLAPVSFRVFGGHATGDLRADVSGPVPSYRVRCTLSQFRIEEALRLLSPDEVANGVMDFSARLTTRGSTRAQLVAGSAGQLALRGRDVTLIGNDLDRTLAKVESQQSFSLGDVGGLFLAGPLSLIVTRGYSFAGVFRGSGGTSHVQILVSEWALERGVARATDVALATEKNRIALQGRLDFAGERFEDVIVAAVDEHGAARVRQAIQGPFRAPDVEKPHLLTTIAGPVLNVFGRIRHALPGTHRPVFYSGKVPPPR